MYLEDSFIKNKIKNVHKLQKGTIYVFEDFLVSEFNEGVIIDFDAILEIYHYLNSYSENKSSFGYISNRVHKYTVKVTDVMKTKVMGQKFYPTAVVTYDEESKNISKFEKQVNNCQTILCESLEKAVLYLNGVLTNVSIT